MIRKTTIDELPWVMGLFKAFEKETKFVLGDVDHAVKVYRRFLESGIGVVFISMDHNRLQGGLAAIWAEDLHWRGRFAVETIWFVDPADRDMGVGTQLLNAFEEWAKSEGCHKVAMIHLSDSYPEILEQYYVSKGYQLMEKHYVKDIV